MKPVICKRCAGVVGIIACLACGRLACRHLSRRLWLSHDGTDYRLCGTCNLQLHRLARNAPPTENVS
jgi:hypothetical protein